MKNNEVIKEAISVIEADLRILRDTEEAFRQLREQGVKGANTFEKCIGNRIEQLSYKIEEFAKEIK